MVLPPPAADAGAAQADWLGKLARSFERAQSSKIVLLRDTVLPRLGEVVRRFSPNPPWAEQGEVLRVCLSGPEMLALPRGSRVILRVRPEDAVWLNLVRPMVAERDLRVVLWADVAGVDALIHDAPDFLHWASRTVEVPPLALPGFAVEGVAAALAANAEFAWRGAGLEQALAEAGWNEGILELQRTMSHHEMLNRLAGIGLPVLGGLKSEHDAWRVRLALAHAERGAVWVAREPEVEIPGMWELHAIQVDWGEATEQLREAGWEHAGLASAWFDLEPTGIVAALDRVEQAPMESGEWPSEDLAKGQAPARVLRLRGCDSDVAEARRLIRDNVKWRLVAEVAELAGHSPSPTLVEELADQQFFDTAMELVLIRWNRRDDERADQVLEWLMQRGRMAEAQRVGGDWVQRAKRGNDAQGRAAAQTWLGNVNVALGNGEQARRLFEDALAIQKQLVEREPGRSDLQRDLSVSFNKLGDVNMALGNGEQARRLFEEALAIRKQLVEREPGRSDLQRDLSVSYINLGDVNVALGNGEQARRFFEEALAIAQQLVEVEPGRSALQRDLSVSYQRLGDVNVALGDGEQARRFFEDALAIAQQLVEREPARSDLQHDISVCCNKLGNIHVALGNGEQARRFFENALAIRKQLVEREPVRSDLQRDLSVSYINLGDVNVALGNGEQARRFFEDAFAIVKQLVEREPARSDLQRDLSISCERLGDANIALGNGEQARRFVEDALTIRKQLVEREPARINLQSDLSFSFTKLGDINLALGNSEAARRLFEDALAVDQRLVEREPGRSDLQQNLAVSLERMATVDPEHRMEWFERSLPLRRAVCKTDPTNALRKRDLARLLDELGAATQNEPFRREALEILQELRATATLPTRDQAWFDRLAPRFGK